MSAVVIAGDTSGTITLNAPAVAGTTTLTLPTTTSTLAINGPAFSAYSGSTQAISATTLTKVNFDTEHYDTASCYDTTNKRFTPTVAGYYQINAWIYGNAAGFTEMWISKNNNTSSGQKINYSYPATAQAGGGSFTMYLNGSTDYIEIYFYSTGTTTLLSGSTNQYFQASLIRSA